MTEVKASKQIHPELWDMNQTLIRTGFTIFFFTSIFLLKAQKISCDTNSCIKHTAGRYEIELVKKCGNRLHVYVNEVSGKALMNTIIIGYIAFYYKGGTMATEDLYQYPFSNYLEAEIPRTGFYNFKVSLIINGESVSAFFDNECTRRTLADLESGYPGQ
ncbi:hypothetical protein CNR22_01745 [Sphingobacteriaceae bacterium]|nr:hypothetical protein CNR22_01745 [Sphingobacteriaceae bacterium]